MRCSRARLAARARYGWRGRQCTNQISRRFSAHGYIMTSTPSTRRLFDGVAVPVPQ
jgi:hypothetical protein